VDGGRRRSAELILWADAPVAARMTLPPAMISLDSAPPDSPIMVGAMVVSMHLSRGREGVLAMRPLPQFAIFAVVGQLILLASAWLLPAVSEYHLVGDNISELAIGQYRFLQTLAFVVSGLGVLALAYAIHRLTAGIRGSLLGSVFIALYGLGALVVAIFPTDRIDTKADVWSQSTTGWIHSISAFVAYLSVITGMLILTWTFARDARWRSLVVGSALLAGAALALLFVQTEGPWIGLMQRLLITAISGWLIVVALRARTIAAAPEIVPSESVRSGA
jgi:hypothetical protein